MPLNVLQFLAKYWKAFAVLCLCGICYYWGAKSNPPEVKTVTQEKTISQTVADDKKVQQNNIVKRIDKKPNGEVIETIVDHSQRSEDDKTASTTKDTKSTTSVQPAAAATIANHEYSLGLSVDYQATINGLEDWRHPAYTAEVGKRLFGDMWVTATYDWKDNIVGLGLRYEW